MDLSQQTRSRPQAMPPHPRDATAAIRGKDPALLRALAIAKKAAISDWSVLVIGETGTGKELVARAIHDASPRAGGPFVPLNCGAIPSELVESELFGHERGAFTGATEPRDGVFVEATGGTLFLDELGELPAAQQPHLLRVLETGRVRRVGGRGERAVDVRIVAATHRVFDLGGALSPLRMDLYHRLATIVVELPPLRDRKDDIPILVRAFLEELEPTFGPRRVPDASMRALLAHHWPGNVRELRQAIRRAAVLCDDALTIDALLPATCACEPSAERDLHTPEVPPLGPGGAGAAQHYELALRAAMQEAYVRWGSIRAAARALGMPKSTFADRARRLGLFN